MAHQQPQQQQQQTIGHWEHETVAGGDQVVTNDGSNINNETKTNADLQQTSSTSISDEQHQNHNTTSADESAELALGETSDGGFVIKTPNSYKYPLLRQYYNFGPWIGRNRKAICLGCHLQTSSSQPDRLLKHLNKCTALSEADKSAVQDLMNERTANKRKKPMGTRTRDLNNDNTTEYYGDDKPSGDDCPNSIPIPPGGLKKMKREHTDRASQIDEALTRFIIMCRIPLKAIHSTEFVSFVKLLDPEYRIPSRETITNTLIPGMLDII